MGDAKFSFQEHGRLYQPAWMSPEALQRKRADRNWEACDMWSFAICIWELATSLFIQSISMKHFNLNENVFVDQERYRSLICHQWNVACVSLPKDYAYKYRQERHHI